MEFIGFNYRKLNYAVEVDESIKATTLFLCLNSSSVRRNSKLPAELVSGTISHRLVVHSAGDLNINKPVSVLWFVVVYDGHKGIEVDGGK